MTNQVSRRSVAKGAAWSVPAVAVAAAAPAAALSNTVSYMTACELFEGSGGGNYQVFRMRFAFSTNDGSVVKKGTVFNYKITMEGSANATIPPGVPATTNTGATFSIGSSTVNGLTRTVEFSITVNADTTSGACTTAALTWDASGDSANVMVPNSVITLEQTGGTAPAGSGTVGNKTSLKFNVGQRHTEPVRGSYNKAFRFISKSEGQLLYPAVQYSFFAPDVAGNGTNGNNCCAGSTSTSNCNNSSTFYPDGTCVKVKITTGQDSVPARA